jgi:hypothetical protein
VKVTAVTPVADASSPSHSDHDRWVKEQTLAMEVAHAQRVGGTLRDAEAENIRLLQRMEALARLEKPAICKPRKSRGQRMLERAVEVREALPKPKTLTWLGSSPCGRCGVCRACMRERRILAISHMATQQKDPWALKSMWSIALFMYKISSGTGEFRGVTKSDARRRVESTAEKLCDDSIQRLGPWLR